MSNFQLLDDNAIDHLRASVSQLLNVGGEGESPDPRRRPFRFIGH